MQISSVSQRYHQTATIKLPASQSLHSRFNSITTRWRRAGTLQMGNLWPSELVMLRYVNFRTQRGLAIDMLDMMCINGIYIPDHLGVLLDPIKQSHTYSPSEINCIWNFVWSDCRIELCYALLIASSSFSVFKNSYWLCTVRYHRFKVSEEGSIWQQAESIVPVHAATDSKQLQFQSARTNRANFVDSLTI